MPKLLLLFFCSNLLISGAWANTYADSLQAITDPLAAVDDSLEYLQSMAQLDSMVASLENSAFEVVGADSLGWAVPGEGHLSYDDEIIMEKLDAIPTTIPMQFNSRVDSWIRLYTQKNRKGVQQMLGLAQLYSPIIEESLDRRGLPMELKYVPVIESAYNTHAVSRVGATGLWQIMYRTGRMLGLRIDTYVDERRDPYKATEAALDYMEQLYGIYGDWLLVIAAYNCGPGNVNKAMRRSGGKKGIWEIFPYLPRETRGYVPAFIAATYTFTYAEEYALYPWKPSHDYTYTDTILFSYNANLSSLTESLDMTLDELKHYNPALKRSYIPGKASDYELRLPLEKALLFETVRDELYASLEKSNETVAVTVAQRSSTSAASDFDPTGYTRMVYTVKSGDNLGFISEWYDVRTQDIRNWNGIYGSRIRAGQKLAIYKKDAEASRFTSVNSMSFDQKQAFVGKAKSSSSSSSAPSSTATASSASGDVTWYTVKSGDSLWEIAQSNPGNTVDKIASLNGISTRSTLKPGMRIKIYK
jgi:membrane-bound lytic murein transglycosylase D